MHHIVPKNPWLRLSSMESPKCNMSLKNFLLAGASQRNLGKATNSRLRISQAEDRSGPAPKHRKTRGL